MALASPRRWHVTTMIALGWGALSTLSFGCQPESSYGGGYQITSTDSISQQGDAGHPSCADHTNWSDGDDSDNETDDSSDSDHLDAGLGGSGIDSRLLKFDVATKPLGGPYAPKNVGAIWIQDANGKFVKTLEVWGGGAKRYLRKFNAYTAGNQVDAVSSATLMDHESHHVTWNLTDLNCNKIPDGTYSIVVEMTDSHTESDSTSISFTNGPEPVMFSPPDAAHFVSMNVVLE